METPTPQQVLDLAMPDNDAGASTVRGYLVALAREVWNIGEGFSGKRPFGNSGWHYEIYGPLVKAGWVKGTFDDEALDGVDTDTADELIQAALDELYAPAETGDEPRPDFTRHDRVVGLAEAVRYHAEVGVDEHEHVVRTAAEMAAFLADGTVPELERDELAPSTALIGVKWVDDEHIEVWVNGAKVAEASYDEQGTEGLLAVERTAVAVARAVGIEPQWDGAGRFKAGGST